MPHAFLFLGAPLSCALGNRNVVQRQFEVLRNMENFLDNFMVNGKSPDAKELPWIQGIRISIKSTRALYIELVKKGPLDFIKTKSLNQDCLENLFSRIRGMYKFLSKLIIYFLLVLIIASTKIKFSSF